MTEPRDKRRAASGGRQQDDGISVADYFVILLDEWRTLLLPIVVCAILAMLYLLVAVPRYRAAGVIQVSTAEVGGAMVFLELAEGRPSPLETEVEILRSRRIVGRAIQSLSLNLAEEERDFTLDLGVSLGGRSPVEGPLKTLRGRIRNLTVADWAEIQIPAEIAADGDGRLSVRLLDSGKSAVVAAGGRFLESGVAFDVARGDGPPAGTKVEVIFMPDDLAVEEVLKSLRVESIGGGRKDTNLVRVEFEATDRSIAKDMVNAVMEAYMAFSLDWRTLGADRSASFIEQQLDVVRAELEKTEQRLQAYVEAHGAVLLPEQAKELIRTGSDLELEQHKVRIQEDLLAMVNASLAQAERSGKPVALTGDFLFDDELLGKAIGTLNELTMKREMLLADVTEVHPQVARLADEIGRVRSQVGDLIKASRQRITERRESIGRALTSMQGELAAFPSKERELAALQRNREVSQELYKFLMTKLQESRILKASTTTDKRIIDQATTPFRRNYPRRILTLFFAVGLGFLLGVAAVFARRAIDPRVRDEEEAKLLAGLPTYGAVPELNGLGIVRQSENLLEAIWRAPKGPAAEAFRTIRTNVEFAQVGEEALKVLQITSSEASEGKSTVIANLAVALAKAGHRVLLVDLDLRRPSQHRTLGVQRTPGVSDYLVGRAELPVHHIAAYEVDFVAAGNEPPESQRLLASDRLAQLVSRWRSQYDYILLDTPPLLVADSLVISRLSDMVLFVVRPRHCHRSHLKLAQSTHERMDLVKGLIINGVTTRRGGYYHYYRGSYYGSRTSDTQES